MVHPPAARGGVREAPFLRVVLVALVLIALVAPAHVGAAPAVRSARDLQPIVLTGADLAELAVVARYVERPPAPMADEAQDGVLLPLDAVPGQEAGTPVDDIAAWRWRGNAFEAIRVQVDERFPRYLTNHASGFGIYSQADLHVTYAFDWEGKKMEGEVEGDPLTAAPTVPGDIRTSDPVPGLDTDDEVVLMWSDAGPRAPSGSLPPHASLVQELRLVDPLTQRERWAYVGRAPEPAAFASYVTYAPDADARAYILSNHGNYGGAPGGACHLGDGVDDDFSATSAACPHRRPKDSATVEGESYRFEGVPIDGVGDELYGTNSEWQQDALGDSYFMIDAPDPTLQGPVANEAWDVATGPYATLATIIRTPPGMQGGALTPYYRDDITFDDGTGREPGSFGAHGIHFFVTGDTDNLFLPAPATEFVAHVTQYVLPGALGNVGEALAAQERVPIVVT